MIFYFNAEGDTLTLLDIKNKAYTRNVNSYLCKFDLDNSWDKLLCFAVFVSGESTYTVMLSEDNSCFIPYEALQKEGTLQIGLFGSDADESDLKRISTNLQTVPVLKGAYSEDAEEATLPKPDTWELLINRNIPKIGENGNWYVWDIEKKEYVDTNMPSRANTPQKGIDYFTEEDIEALNIPSVDPYLDEMSENAVSNRAVTEALSGIQNMFYPTDVSDTRYLFRKETFFDGTQTIYIDDHIENTTPFDYRIYGNNKQSSKPTSTKVQEISFVGDLVTNKSDAHYGQYRVVYFFNAKKYTVYLDEPLRGIVGYGTSSESPEEKSFYALDFIDFENQRVVRNVQEAVISNFPEPSPVIQNHSGKLWLCSSTIFYDNLYTHPEGNNQTGDIISNAFQRVTKNNGSYTITDNYVLSPDNTADICFYMSLNSLGLTAEESTADDYTVFTADETPTYYKIKDSTGSYMTLAQIQSQINKHYQNSTVKIYYPLAFTTIENVTLNPLPVMDTEIVDFSVSTRVLPAKIYLEYYADLSASINKISRQLDDSGIPETVLE